MAETLNEQLWFSDRVQFEDFTSLKEAFLEVLFHLKPKIVVFDGVSASTLGFARGASFSPYRLVYVSSEQLKALDPSKQLALTREHRVNPWKLSEYDSVLSDS